MTQGAQKEEFTEDEFLKQWHAYADILKASGKSNLFNILTANAPKIEGENITVYLDNTAQNDFFNSEKINLLNHLREKLKNYQLQISTKITPLQKKKTIYTNKHKYEHLVNINPDLNLLIQKFKLETL